MRVLMLAPGSWLHSKRTLNCLLESGHEVTFVDGDNPLPEGHQGYTFLPYPRSGRRFYKKLLGESLGNRIAEKLVVAQLRKLWREFRPDVVHVCWLDKRAYQCVQAGLKPLVLSVWGSDLNSQFLSDARPHDVSMIAQTLASADLTIVDAPDMHQKCSVLVGREIRTEELHMGADMQLFRPDAEAAKAWRRKLAIPADAKVLVSIRAMASRYGHHLILEAFARALPRFKSSAFLVFKHYSHSETAYLSELRDLASKHGVGDRIRWIGEVPQKEMPEFYALAEAIINLPVMDAFPVTFVEAAACECMVISCRLPSYKGTFAEKYFLMVEPDNLEALSDAIARFVNESEAEQNERLTRLAELRRLVLSEYDESVYSRRLSDLYREVAHGNSSVAFHARAVVTLCVTSVVTASLFS